METCNTETRRLEAQRYMETGNTEMHGDRIYRDTWRQEIQRYMETGNTEIHGDRNY